MSDITQRTRLMAARELLLGIPRGYTSMPAEQEANVQEAVEHIDRTLALLGEVPERDD